MRALRSLGALYLAAALVALLATSAQASRSAGSAVGTLSVCNATGTPPVATVITFTIVAPASEGGTQVATLGPGACSANYFLSQGLQVTVIENVPTGAFVASITISGESALTQTSLAGGVATVTIGNAASVLTFTTKGAAVPAPVRPCVVPRVIGLNLAAARRAIKAAACRVKSVSHIYSSRIPKGGVTSTKPRAGAHLAHNGKVRVNVSRGRKR
jgi:PASTA domain